MHLRAALCGSFLHLHSPAFLHPSMVSFKAHGHLDSLKESGHSLPFEDGGCGGFPSTLNLDALQPATSVHVLTCKDRHYFQSLSNDNARWGECASIGRLYVVSFETAITRTGEVPP